MNITALLHILLMANLVGLLVPEVMLGRQYWQAASHQAKRSLALVHARLAGYAQWMLLLTVLTGIGRVFESDYPWFAFDTMLWLALKQLFGILLVVWVAINWARLRKVTKKLRSGNSSEAETESHLKLYERIKGRSHVVTGMAWLLAALAILKP